MCTDRNLVTLIVIMHAYLEPNLFLRSCVCMILSVYLYTRSYNKIATGPYIILYSHQVKYAINFQFLLVYQYVIIPFPG